MPNTFTRVSKTAWTHRWRFNLTAANDTNRYFASASDVSDSMSKWDLYDSDPTGMAAANIYTGYIAPIKCYLASYEAIASSGTADDRPYQIELYYGTPSLNVGGDSTLTLATVSTGATSHDERREPERLYEDWGKTIILDQGDIVITTIKSNYDGMNAIVGSIVIFFKEF